MSDKTNGTITIGRATSNQEPENFMRLEIVVGRKRILVETSMEDFAFALTGRSGTPCSVAIKERS